MIQHRNNSKPPEGTSEEEGQYTALITPSSSPPPTPADPEFDAEDFDDDSPPKSLKSQLLLFWHTYKTPISLFSLCLILVFSTHTNSQEYTSGGYFGSGKYRNENENPLLATSLRQSEGIRLARTLQHLADVDEPVREGDVPLFFHVPRSGGSTMKDIMGSCLGMVEASDVGARKGHSRDKELAVIHSDDGSSYVNVDTTTPEGIHHAKTLNLIDSGLADVVITQHLHPAATLFNSQNRGRMFTMIRNPIERAVSLFHYLGVADWEPTYDPDLAYISIEMYARSQRIEHNWMTRFLSNEMVRDLTPKHLEVAKEVLRKKCLIGLLNDKANSFHRFETFFGWKFSTPHKEECQDRLLHWGWSNKHVHPLVEEGSPAWQLLLKKNEYDMKLYEYAKVLYKEQERLFWREGEKMEDNGSNRDVDLEDHEDLPFP